MIFFTVGFCAMFGMLIYQSYLLNTYIKKTNCTLAHIPKEINEGVESKNQHFLGISNLVQVLSDFSSESINIKNSLSTNFVNIFDAKIGDYADHTSKALQTFYSIYSGNLFLGFY